MKKKGKKLISIALTVAMIAGLTACEGVGCGIYDIHIGVELFHFAFNGGKKVCFSESRLTVYGK